MTPWGEPKHLFIHLVFSTQSSFFEAVTAEPHKPGHCDVL